MELLERYEACKSATKNFTYFEQDLLFKHTDYLEILRKLAGLTHTKFERAYYSKYSSRFRASNYELKRNKLGKKVSTRLAELFTNIFKNIQNKSFEKITEYNERVQRNIKSHQTGDEAEDIVQKYLIKHKINFHKHARIVGFSRIAHKIDFLIGDKYNPQAIIEVKKSNELKHNSMAKTKELVATAVDIKKKHPVIFLVYLVGAFSEDSINFLKSYCDKVIVDEPALEDSIFRLK